MGQENQGQTILSRELREKIDNIGEALEWVKEYQPNDFPQRFLQLMEERRKLRKIWVTEGDNPAIAAFGKSQVGKSYLIGNLLQDSKGNPFRVKANGVDYNFVECINPIGDDKEATGVVTRFSSFSRSKVHYSEKYPVVMRPIQVKDLVLILCDSYFNDFSDFTSLDEQTLEELGNDLFDRYKHNIPLEVQVMSPEDILDIKYYFNKHINNAQAINKKSVLFDKIAMVIDRIPVSDYVALFSPLWYSDKEFTALFSYCLSILKKLQFSTYVNLPIEAVLHEGIKHNTVMSVECLKKLYSEEMRSNTTDVYVNNKNDNFQKITTITKSEACAICAEVAFLIDDQFISNSGQYNTASIPQESLSKLPSNMVSMDILRDNDLLDFPGARSREKRLIDNIVGNEETLLYCFLRGKVAYLFNKYNDDRAINILLYSHHNKDNDVTNLWQLINQWVESNVGKWTEDRARTLQSTGGISPLFYIGTMFDLELAHSKNGETGDSENAIRQRWIGRFQTVLLDQCFHPTDAKWVENWSREGEHFQNCYIIRDYKFSNGIYAGFEPGGAPESKMLLKEEYYQTLRRTFIDENNKGYRLFADPALSWDVATTMSNDGTLYIMQNLSKIAPKMIDTRNMQFRDLLRQSVQTVYTIMKEYFVSENIDDLLQERIRKARAIFREMDFTCNNDNYFFGHLLQTLQLTQTEVYNVVHSIITSPDLSNAVHNFKDYELIRHSCKKSGYPLEEISGTQDKWNAIVKTYGFNDKDEAEKYLQSRGVDSERLFSDNIMRKQNSFVIADKVFAFWAEGIKSADKLNEISGNYAFDSIAFGSLVEALIYSAKKVDLQDRLAQSIAEYVNVLNLQTINEHFLADILASQFNNFVLDFGYEYLDSEEREKANKILEDNDLSNLSYIHKKLPDSFDEASLTQLFKEIGSTASGLILSFEDNYNKWIEFMYVSFIAHLDIPDYDRVANKLLGGILEKISVENL